MRNSCGAEEIGREKVGVEVAGTTERAGLSGVKVGTGVIVIVGVDAIKDVDSVGRVLQATIMVIETIQKHCRISDFGSIGQLLILL